MAVRGVGRTETCITHFDRVAVARCSNCHKPVCGECVVSTADGKFCSRDCAAKAADFKKSYKPIKTGGASLMGRLIKLVVWLVVIVIVLGIFNRNQKIPVIGPWLDKLPYIGAGK